MIKLQSIHIEEFRGIRKLTLDLKGKNFAICGRNGTGKSGIVDAIEFGLTGNISRLSGEGTDKLSVKAHAPHVDMRSDPEKALVKLTVEIPSLAKTVTITRSPKDARRPTVSPSSAAILSALSQVENHPEIVLTRREIIRYVLAPEGKRATEVQAVLRLEHLGSVRQTLRTIANAGKRDATVAKAATVSAIRALKQALGVPTLTERALLSAVNAQRKVLGLAALPELTSTTSVKDGISGTSGSAAATISKASAMEDLAAFQVQMRRLGEPASDDEMKKALALTTALSRDATLLTNLSREEFLRTGFAFIDQSLCPFCDEEWSISDLRAHITKKLSALDQVKLRRARAESTLEPILLRLEEAREILQRMIGYARSSKPPRTTANLRLLKTSIESAMAALQDFLPIDAVLAVLERPPAPNSGALKELAELGSFITGLPEPSKEGAAREWLVIAQERLTAYRRTKRAQLRLEAQADLSSKVAETYATVLDAELNQLYRVVEHEFAEMYGELNAPDEAEFAAQLVPSIGKLGFGVNFYGRGMFPPGAYHSEGHQDAMGLCLYLALMSHVLKGGFQLAVLDDVLMSVDAGHRRAICTMLKKRFPDTQFILTTHDPVWLNHMRTEGLVTAKSLIRFRAWDVNVGPTTFGDTDIWIEIDKELAADRVALAAELLRNHLEYTAGELCYRLSARTEHRLDERFELGMLLPPAYEQLSTLYGKGKAAANSWGQKELVDQLTKRQERLAKSHKATNIDQWQINAAIHYNSWASLQKEDFRPLVAAFKDMVDEFRCSNCQAFLFVLKEGGTPKSVACDCGQGNFNLTRKDGTSA